ncbi:MAG: PQQ-dependent sugar dehydrogenase [Dehalococcoidia bacterium]
MSRRPIHLPVIRRRAAAIGVAVVIALVVLIAACGGGEEAPAPTATPSIVPTPTSTPEPTPTLAPGQRRRWGFDPLKPTGLTDPQIPFDPLPRDYDVERILTGLDRPTQLAIAPDGTIYIAEQPGTVRVVRGGHLDPDPFISLEVYLPDLPEQVELGLTGIALDPHFEDNGYVYLYYTEAEPRQTTITRARALPDGTVEVTPILSWPGAPECCHVSGGMRFLPDGTLLVGVGDHEDPASAQNPAKLTGSILRINFDGSAPPDNPFSGGEDGADAHVFAYGLRNPYDSAFDPATGRIFAGENGFFGQDGIIQVLPGANYGWPGSRLHVPESEVQPPLTFYHQYAGLAGMEFYSSDVLGELTGSLLFCRFHGGTLNQLTFRPDGSVAQERSRARNCTSDVTTGPDGFVYYLDYVEGSLYRISVR